MKRFLPWIVLATTCLAQDAPPPPRPAIEPPAQRLEPLPVPEDAPEAIRTLIAELAEEGVTVDFEKRIVEVKTVFLLERMQADYPIEYLIVTNDGFSHEALAKIRATPSKLNAAFLALGLEPGRTVQFERKEPPPPLEKLVSGEEREFTVTPPSGPVVDIDVRWTDEGGERIHPIEDLIVYVTNRRPLPRRGFVYVGSRFQRLVLGGERAEKFMADVEGNVVSLYLSGFGNCLFDMNSDEGIESHMYDVNTALVPKAGTIATLVFRVR